MAPRAKKHSSAPPSAAPSSVDTQKAKFRQEITALYQTHNPEKVKDVDWLMKKYAGSEEDLIHAIKTKYNVV